MAKRPDGKAPPKRAPRKGPKRKEPSGAEKRRRRKVKAALGLPPGSALPPAVLAAVKPAAEEAPSAPVDEEAPLDFDAALTEGDTPEAVWEEAIRVQRQCMRLSVNADPATGSRLERTARIAQGLVKAVDPKRQIEEMGAELRDAHELIQTMRGGDGVQEPPQDPGRAPTASH